MPRRRFRNREGTLRFSWGSRNTVALGVGEVAQVNTKRFSSRSIVVCGGRKSLANGLASSLLSWEKLGTGIGLLLGRADLDLPISGSSTGKSPLSRSGGVLLLLGGTGLSK